MMKSQNSNEKQMGSKWDYFEQVMVMYFDIVIRGVISFVGVTILATIIFMGVFHLSLLLTLLFSFFISVAIAPLLSRLRFAQKGINWYKDKLDSMYNEKK